MTKSDTVGERALTPAQLDGMACVVCGADARVNAMVPAGRIGERQLFVCENECQDRCRTMFRVVCAVCDESEAVGYLGAILFFVDHKEHGASVNIDRTTDGTGTDRHPDRQPSRRLSGSKR